MINDRYLLKIKEFDDCYQYTYSKVQFNRKFSDRRDSNTTCVNKQESLRCSISRSISNIKELVMCNRFDYFFTLTIADVKRNDVLYSCNLINNAIKHIHKNIEREITLEELASISCTERNYFIKLFKKNMFVTPYQYIKNYRMTKAVSLLERGYPVSDVGIRIGYSDVSAFSHAFKKEYDIYPSEFIKQKKHS